MVWLVRVYDLMPGWLVAAVLLLASASWVVNYHYQMRYERIPLYPPMSLGLAAALAALAMFYMGLAFGPELPENARAGGVRVLLLVLAMTMIIYNGGMITRSLRKLVKDIK